MTNPSYPFDPTGKSPDNLVVNEQHAVQTINYKNFYLIVPQAAPFYTTNFKVTYTNDNTSTINFIEGVDYIFVFPYQAATRSIGISVYGGILVLDTKLTGVVGLDYQTIGGSWVANTNKVLENVAEQMYNPRSVYWDVLTDVQETFPPINHSLHVDTTYGYDDLINEINMLTKAIANKPVAPINIYTNPSSTASEDPNVFITWPINVAGSAASATTADVAKHIESSGQVDQYTIDELAANSVILKVPDAISGNGKVILDASTANYYSIVLDGNVELSFKNVPEKGFLYTAHVEVTQNATGGHSVVWPPNTLSSGGAIPATTSAGLAKDIFRLFTYDAGATWFIAQVFKNAR